MYSLILGQDNAADQTRSIGQNAAWDAYLLSVANADVATANAMQGLRAMLEGKANSWVERSYVSSGALEERITLKAALAVSRLREGRKRRP